MCGYFRDKDALLDAIIDATGAGLVVPALPGLEGRRAAAGLALHDPLIEPLASSSYAYVARPSARM